MSWTIISLGLASPQASSDLPGGASEPRCTEVRPPYLALLRVGFAVPALLPAPRCALTTPFHPYRCAVAHLGGLLSVALSVDFHPPGVTWHPVRRSPDFPLPSEHCTRRQRLSGQLSEEIWCAHLEASQGPLLCENSALPLSYARENVEPSEGDDPSSSVYNLRYRAFVDLPAHFQPDKVSTTWRRRWDSNPRSHFHDSLV